MNNFKPPHSMEVEQALLCLLLSNSKSHFAIDKVCITDFFNMTHRALFEAIKKLYDDKKNIDIYTVFEEAKKIADIEIKYINSLVTTTPVLDTIENYILILKEKAVLRSIIEKCNETLISAYKGESDAIDLKVKLAQSLDEISVLKTQDDNHIKDIFHQILDDVSNFNEDEVKKYYTGLDELDKRTFGLHKEEVTVIAARPSAGKTALALQITTNFAMSGLRTYFVSREMSKKQMAKRVLAANGVYGDGLRINNLTDDQQVKMVKVMGQLSKLNMHIDSDSKSIQEIKQRIREYKAEVLIIDYLQLLEPSNKKIPREQQVSELSREIKNISLDFKIPVLLLSQLNRQPATRKPVLADLRESGAIEQDANNVWFIHVPQKDELEEHCNDEDSPITLPMLKKVKDMGARLVEVIIAKQRDGETGSFFSLFLPHKLQFINLNFRRD